MSIARITPTVTALLLLPGEVFVGRRQQTPLIQMALRRNAIVAAGASLAAPCLTAAFRLVPSITRRRSAGHFFEGAVELRERLKTDRERDFTNPFLRIAQEAACSLNANMRQVVNEIDTSDLLKFFTQVVRTDIDRFGYSGERELLT